LLAGNLLALIPLAAWAAIPLSRSQPVVDLAALYVTLGAILIVPATLFIELPLLRRLYRRPRTAAPIEERVVVGLIEEVMIIALAGVALAVPGGLLGALAEALSNQDGVGTPFSVAFMVAAVAAGFMGMWCALLGRWAYQATKQSKVVSIAILAVIAAAVVWILVLFFRSL
jgi:hypothetical protein